MTIQQATTTAHLQGILQLQKENHKDHLPESVKNQEGFLTVKHTLELLEAMNREIRHIIALDEDKVVGYALSMPVSLRNRIPVLASMFEKLEDLNFNGQPLKNSNFYIMGQVCVDREYRGKGMLTGLYQKHRELYSRQFDYLITEVSANNPRSVRAHEKVGFETILKYRDDTDFWHLILWDWTKNAPAEEL